MLEIRNLDVNIGPVPILRGVGMDVPAGAMVGLIGRNGAGKTTLLRSIMGLLKSQAGSIAFDGNDITSSASHRRAHLGIGYMPEDRRLVPDMSAEENILVPVWSTGQKDYEKRLQWIYELMPEIREFRDRGATQLSGGQQKMVALGRALKLEDTWPLETAATFSELGSVALPALLLEKALNGRALQLEEERTLDRSRVTTDQLLRRIPQLELVRGIVALVQRGRLPEGLLLPPTDDAYARRLAGILHVAIDHEALEASGNKPTLAAEMLRGRRTDYHGEVLDALGVLFERSERLGQVYELPPSALEVGMTLADDLRLSTGAMLVPRGYQVTPALVARLVNLSDSAVRGKARVYRRTL